jgi:outer membrane immunogenic protein
MKGTLIAGAALSLITLSAFAADLAIPPSRSLPLPPAFTWTSCYGGLHAGGGVGQKDLNDTTSALFPTTGFSSANLNIRGYMLGGQIGCDYQLASSWVVGLEGAVSGGNIGGQTSFATPGIAGDTSTFKATTDFLMSATLRVGYAWDRWMIYAKGGAAWAGDKYDAFDSLSSYAFEGLENRFGWTAGAGLEWAMWEDWSIRLEYQYYGFGQRSVLFIDSTISMTQGPENIKQNIQVITLGVNFHVSAWP